MGRGSSQYKGVRACLRARGALPEGKSRNIGAGSLALAMALSLAWAILVAAGVIGVAGGAQAGESLAAPIPGGEPVYSLEHPEEVTRLTVTVNKSQTIRLDRPFAEALVGNAEIADVIPLTDRTLYLLGKQIGGTRVSIIDANRRLLGIVEIEVAYDAEAIRAQFERSLPGSSIKVTPVNGAIMLTGLVTDAIALEKAIAIANQYAPNAVNNALTVAGSQQVLLEVRFIEASRSASRNLGVKLGVNNPTGSSLTNPGNLNLLTNLGAAATGIGAFPTTVLPFGSMVTQLLNGGVSADMLIQALEEKGLARRLAEPNLVALSGDTASFLAGGEFPFPVARTDDNITIEFKKFGVGLAFTPTVLNNGLINLKVEPEVSEIDPTNTLVVNDTTIPGLVTRRAKTTVELRDGQSFAIAGLLQSNHSKASRQLPWIGQVPVLGALFRSASYEKNETDLVIIVTPRLVRPAAPDEPLITPFDKDAPSNDVEFFLGGKIERPGWRAHVQRTKNGLKAKTPASGHMLGVEGPALLPVPGGYKSSYKPAAAPLVTGAIDPARTRDERPSRDAGRAGAARLFGGGLIHEASGS